GHRCVGRARPPHRPLDSRSGIRRVLRRIRGAGTQRVRGCRCAHRNSSSGRARDHHRHARLPRDRRRCLARIARCRWVAREAHAAEPRAVRRTFHMNDLYSQVERVALRHPSRELLVTDGGQRYTWSQLHEQTARYANALTSVGVRHADRVAVQVDKSVESLFVYLACLRAGFVYLPLNTAYQRAELSYFIGDAQPRAVVCRPQNHAEMAAMAAGATVFTMDEEGA